MNCACVLVLAVALFGALGEAYVSSVGYNVGVGYNGIGGAAGIGGGIGAGYGAGYGAGVGAGYGGEFEGGYGRVACGSAVSDTCQCVKTIVRPIVERIPYSCSRRVHSPGCRTGYGVYSGNLYGRTGAAVGTAALGAGALGAGAGYLNNGYVV